MSISTLVSVLTAENAANKFVFKIPDAGGAPLGAVINWAAISAGSEYAQLVAPNQSGPVEIGNGPANFTLDTQHFGIAMPPVI